MSDDACAACLLLDEINPTNPVTTFKGTSYCRKHLLADEMPFPFATPEQWMAHIRGEYERRERERQE